MEKKGNETVARIVLARIAEIPTSILLQLLLGLGIKLVS